MFYENLIKLREKYRLSQEDVAEQIDVSRQTVAKWEAGTTMPDLLKCEALAKLYDVSIDDLLHYSESNQGIPIPTKGKHVFGTVTMGEKGQIVIPKKCRDVFGLRPGDDLIILGDEKQGIGIMKAEVLLDIFTRLKGEDDDEG